MDSWWMVLLLILDFQHGSHLAAGGFLSVPKASILGIVGNGVVLPCQVGSSPIPKDFSIRWTFQGQSRWILVSSYGGKDPREDWDERYRGRVEFFHREFGAGNVSLLLRNVRSSDQGSYSCEVSFQGGSWRESVELEVAAIGEAPSVILQSREKQDLGLSCRSSGWFPRPELLWLDGRGKFRKESVTTTATLTPEGVFSIEASVQIRPGSDLEISCRILNRQLNVSRESRICIHEVFLPSISRWLQIFLAALFLNLALISIVFCQIRGSQKRTLEAGKATLRMEEEKKKVKSVLDGEKAKKRNAKIQFKKDFGQLKAELDFWEARSHAVPVALHPEARPLDLGSARDSLPIAALLAKEALGAEKSYWEVELGGELDWAVGVLRDGENLPGPNSRRDSCGEPRHDPRDCWALRSSHGQLFSSRSGSGSRALGQQRGDLSALGMLLDPQQERLEFYDVQHRELVAGMALQDPAGKFLPFVSRGEEGKLRIRPVLIPVPL